MLRERGARCILVEAGPSTAADLYQAPPVVDELLLSVYEEPELAAEFVGTAFASRDRIEQIFDWKSEPQTRDEASGRWTFQRLRRTTNAVG